MGLVDMVSQYGNIVKKGFVSQLEKLGKDKTTVVSEDVFASPKTLEQLGKDRFRTPEKYQSPG